MPNLTKSYETVQTGVGPMKMYVVKMDHVPVMEFATAEQADKFIREFKRRL